MAKILDNNGIELNIVANVEEIDNILGLVFESRGGRNRNPDYNIGLELILERLKNLDIDSIRIIIVSSVLLKRYHDPIDRTLIIDGSSNIKLKKYSSKDLRIAIGKAQTKIKVDPSTKGGNANKKIQLVVEELHSKDWGNIIIGNTISKVRRLKPTFDEKEFEKEVESFMDRPLEQIPEGNPNPKRRKSVSPELLERDPAVKAWIIKNSKGFCEKCNFQSPFIKTNGQFFMEVHHVKLLAENGEDTIYNSVAVCPNCHRELHYGKDKEKIIELLYEKIARLRK